MTRQLTRHIRDKVGKPLVANRNFYKKLLKFDNKYTFVSDLREQGDLHERFVDGPERLQKVEAVLG